MAKGTKGGKKAGKGGFGGLPMASGKMKGKAATGFKKVGKRGKAK